MKVVIIGGGQAGLSLAAGLRKRDSSISITLLCAEAYFPYQRPPLSKAYLLGDIPTEKLFLRSASWYEAQNMDVHLNCSVTQIDRAQKVINCGDGRVFTYDKLGFATGSTPRCLPKEMTFDAQNIFTLRTILDIDRLRPMMQKNARLLIVGGGYIGLEAAAVARKLGLKVSLIEAAPRLLQRVASAETADFFRQLHSEQGVLLSEGVGIKKFLGDEQKIKAVLLNDGSSLECDFVLVGIGVIPNVALAQSAGIACDQGVLVNQFTQTSDPNIYGAGDCARFVFRGQLIRLESVQNALDQADCVAANMLGENQPYNPRPWFWSDQYHVKLQIVGLNTGYDRTVMRSGAKKGSCSIWYYRGQQLCAVDALNDVRSYSVAKKIIDQAKNIPSEVVADVTSNLKDWIPTTT